MSNTRIDVGVIDDVNVVVVFRDPAVVYIPSAPETSAEPVLWVPIRVTEVTECELMWERIARTNEAEEA